jgi:hypothetical protein
VTLKSPESACKSESVLAKRKEREEAEDAQPLPVYKDHLMVLDELLGESSAQKVTNVPQLESPTKRIKTEEPLISLINPKKEEPIEDNDMHDEPSGPSSVSFAPILEQDREFSFQNKFESQKNEDSDLLLEISDAKRDELKGFIPLEDNSFSKSYDQPRPAYYS